MKLGRAEKALAAALLMFISVATLGFCLLDTVGLAFFNMVFGNEVYTVTIAYYTVPDYNLKGELSSIYFEWNITLGKAKVPIETVLCNYKVDVTSHGSSRDLGNVTVCLPVTVWVANKIKLFQHTFNFEDAKARQITIYVYKLDPSRYSKLFVEINGYYMLGDEKASLKVGANFNVEA